MSKKFIKPFYKDLECTSDFSKGTGRNVLYLGMADDILSPFWLIPNIENLWVIDLFDGAFCTGYTRDSQRNDIRKYINDMGFKILSDNLEVTHKSDRTRDIKFFEEKNAWCIETGKNKGDGYYKFTKKPLEIIKNDKSMEGIWTVTFQYPGQNVIRQLKYFSDNFWKEWNEEIQDLTDIVGIEAVGLDYYEEDDCEHLDIMNKMFLERTREKFTLHLLEFLHYYFPYKIEIYEQRQCDFPTKRKIAYFPVDKSKSGNKIINYILSHQNFISSLKEFISWKVKDFRDDWYIREFKFNEQKNKFKNLFKFKKH